MLSNYTMTCYRLVGLFVAETLLLLSIIYIVIHTMVNEGGVFHHNKGANTVSVIIILLLLGGTLNGIITTMAELCGVANQNDEGWSINSPA